MSDSEAAVEPKKGRGRPVANADKSNVTPKKRARAPSPKDEEKVSDKGASDDGETPSKRGRGRPKGSTKKSAAKPSKKEGKSSGRGRPKKKSARDESTEEDTEGNEENDENESDA